MYATEELDISTLYHIGVQITNTSMLVQAILKVCSEPKLQNFPFGVQIYVHCSTTYIKH